MYERFTEQARKVMQLAKQEAQRHNRDSIGTEHILLCLIDDSSGVAMNVLQNLKVDLHRIRTEVERLIAIGPETVSTDQQQDTTRVKNVMKCALEEARSLNNNYVGTEHMLLGLLKVNEGVAAQALRNLQIRYEHIREGIVDLLNPHHNVSEEQVSKREDELKRVQLMNAYRQAIEQLEGLIKQYVRWQNYELAADLRDHIIKLKKELEKYTKQNE